MSACSGSKLFDTLIRFLKYFFRKKDLFIRQKSMNTSFNTCDFVCGTMSCAKPSFLWSCDFSVASEAQSVVE